MNNQNSYTNIQYCIKCNQPLEKARVGAFKGRGVCLKCQRKHNNEKSKAYNSLQKKKKVV